VQLEWVASNLPFARALYMFSRRVIQPKRPTEMTLIVWKGLVDEILEVQDLISAPFHIRNGFMMSSKLL